MSPRFLVELAPRLLALEGNQVVIALAQRVNPVSFEQPGQYDEAVLVKMVALVITEELGRRPQLSQCAPQVIDTHRHVPTPLNTMLHASGH